MDGPSRTGCSSHQELWLESRETKGSSRRLLLVGKREYLGKDDEGSTLAFSLVLIQLLI